MIDKTTSNRLITLTNHDKTTSNRIITLMNHDKLQTHFKPINNYVNES